MTLLLLLFLLAQTARVSIGPRSATEAFLLGDWSHSEVYQYLKFLAIIWLVIWLSMHYSRRFLGWLPIFGYLLLDDAARIHEEGGRRLAEWGIVSPAFGFDAQPIGEMLISAIAASGSLALIAATYTGANIWVKTHYKHLLFLAAALFFFGAALDLVHSVIPESGMFMRFFKLTVLEMIEDGGEMVVVSLILAYLLAVGNARI